MFKVNNKIIVFKASDSYRKYNKEEKKLHIWIFDIAQDTSTLNQRWSIVDRQHSSTLFQCWCLVENENWADIHLSTLFQHWQNNVEKMFIELRRFNVDDPTLFQRWNSVENESWANVCLSTLFQRWQNNVDRITSINADDPKLFQCWYLVEKESWVNVCSSALRKQSRALSIFVVLMFTRKWLNNKTKLSFQVKIMYFFYIRT